MIDSTTELRPLTKRQQQIYDLIKTKIQDTGMPPTRAEIANFLVLNQLMPPKNI